MNDTVEMTTYKTGARQGQLRKSKLLSRKSKLTAKIINKLTIYFGLAIRRNSDSVEKMRKAIWATYLHSSSTDAEPHHENCPTGADSWCSYQKAMANGQIDSYTHDYSPLPEDVLKAIEPIYKLLSEQKLLERCVGGFTQNNNESLNQLIWKIAPKKLSGSVEIVEIAAHVASSVFNEGNKAYLSFLNGLGLSVGPSAQHWACMENSARINNADKKASEQSKEGRMKQRQEKKDAVENAESSGDILYGAGIDDSM